LVGVLEAACLEHHKRFFTVQNKKRPYIILKWAETKEGYIAPKFKEEQQPIWISNSYSQQLVHKWRSEEHAILVGTNTVIADNPMLNVRSWSGQSPVRIVLDRTLRIPSDASVFDGTVKTIVITACIKNTQELGGNIILEEIDFSKNLGNEICTILQKHKIQSVIIEGGATTLQTFIDEDLWDEARVFTGDVSLNSGVRSPKFSASVSTEMNIKNDVLKIYRND
jgi:diaminohydroxyphosphoribosylaminopyrimidine deaminase/5-amino-6-(5-phosphoribosylamino)uracil reductase